MKNEHLQMFSGGAGSWASSKRVAASYGTESLVLLFADPLAEHRETYRCLVEGAANVYGLPKPEELSAMASLIPDLSTCDEINLCRKNMLRDLSAAAMEVIPGLVWLCDGRLPWEVFRDVRFVGRSGKDPCSKHLKRELQDAWRNANCDPVETTCYVGLDWSEMHRMDGRQGKPGLRQRMAEIGWRYKAPMGDEPPFLTKQGMLDWQESEGIRRSQSYALGFPHDNCSGGCCKGGHATWKLLLKHRPEVYAYNEHQEQAAIVELGPSATMLNDRRGGERKPLSLKTFRERLETEAYTEAEQRDFEFGGCGCAID